MTIPSRFRVLDAEPPAPERQPRQALRASARGYRSSDGGFEVLVPTTLLARLRLFSKNAAPHEWLGIVVGQLLEDDAGPYLLVLGVVPDENAITTPVTVRSTPEGEARTQQLAALLYPDGARFGWAHTHPGHGTRFSATDRENQARWTHPRSVGLVIDHTAPPEVDLGVYLGPQAERLSRWEPPGEPTPEAGDPGRTTPSPTRTTRRRPPPTNPAKTAQSSRHFNMALFFAVIIVTALLYIPAAIIISAQLAKLERDVERLRSNPLRVEIVGLELSKPAEPCRAPFPPSTTTQLVCAE